MACNDHKPFTLFLPRPECNFNTKKYIYKFLHKKFYFLYLPILTLKKRRAMSNMKCFIHSFIHFIFLIYNTVDIFVFISTMHLLFHAKQKYRTRELSYCCDHNARNLDSNSPYWCIDAKHRNGVWDFPLQRRHLYSYFRTSRSHDFAHDMTMLNTICLTHSVWKMSFIAINMAQSHHFCFPAYIIWHTGRCYHCVQNIFYLLENSIFFLCLVSFSFFFFYTLPPVFVYF